MWGPSTQAGFAEYRLIVKEKANQVEDTANKESEKLSKGAETVDQTKRVTPKVIEGSSLVKPSYSYSVVKFSGNHLASSSNPRNSSFKFC